MGLVQDVGQLDAVLCSADAAFVRAHPEQLNVVVN